MEGKNYPNPGVAAVLSFLFIGLGQIYNGHIGKAITLMTITSVSFLMLIAGTALVIYSLMGLFGLCKIGCGIFLMILSIAVLAITGIYSLYDAYNTARK